jgi:hypothetical protein
MWGALLDQTVAYQRSTPAPDGGGGVTRTWVTKIAGMICSIQSARSDTVYWFQQRGIRIDWSVYTTVDINAILGSPATPGDRLLTSSGSNLVVMGVKRDQNFVISPEPIYQLDCQLLVE